MFDWFNGLKKWLGWDENKQQQPAPQSRPQPQPQQPAPMQQQPAFNSAPSMIGQLQVKSTIQPQIAKPKFDAGLNTEAINKGLDQGRSWEDIAKQNNIAFDQVKAFSESTRPQYGITPPQQRQSEQPALGQAFSKPSSPTMIQAKGSTPYYENKNDITNATISAGKGAVGSLLKTVPYIVNTTAEFGGNTVKFFDKDNAFGNYLVNKAKKNMQEADSTLSAFSKSKNDNDVAYDIGSAGGGMARDIALTIASGGAGAGMKVAQGASLTPSVLQGLNVANTTVDNATSHGVDFDKAYGLGVTSGLAQGALEKVGLDKITKPFGSNMLTRIGSRMLSEGAQEGAQQLTDNAFTKTYDSRKDLWDGVAYNAALGAVVGGGAGVVLDVPGGASKVTSVSPKSVSEHRMAVDNGIITPITKQASLEDKIRTAENSDLSPNRVTNAPTHQQTINVLKNSPQDSVSGARAYNSGINSSRKGNGAEIVDILDGGKSIAHARQDQNGNEKTLNGLSTGKVPTYEGASANFSTPAQSQFQYPGSEHVAESPSYGGTHSNADFAQYVGIDTPELVTHSNNTVVNDSNGIRFRDSTYRPVINQPITPHILSELEAEQARMFGTNQPQIDIRGQIDNGGQAALGATVDDPAGTSQIQIANNQLDPQATLMHESVHKALNDYMTTQERNVVVQSYAIDRVVPQEQGETSQQYLYRVEEHMSEDFIQYVANRHSRDIPKPTLSRRIALIFERVWRRIQMMTLRRTEQGTLTPEYMQFYQDLHDGKFAKKDVIDKALRDETPESLAIKEYIGTLQKQFESIADQKERHVINQQIAGLNRELQAIDTKYRQNTAKKQKVIDIFNQLLTSKHRSSAQVATVTDTTARMIQNATGEIVTPGSPVALTSGNVRHIHKRHIVNTQDSLPLSKSDIGNMADVIESPDGVNVGKFERGSQRVLLTKQVDKEHTAVVEVIKKGDALNVVTYFNNSPSRRLDMRAPQDVRPNRNESANLPNSIANNPRIVNDRRFRMVGNTNATSRRRPAVSADELASDTLAEYNITMKRSDFNQALDEHINDIRPELAEKMTQLEVELEQVTNNDILLQNGGSIRPEDARHYFGSNYTESIPRNFIRKDAAPIDIQAQERGFSDIDQYVEHLQRPLEIRKEMEDIKQETAKLWNDPRIRRNAKEIAEIRAYDRVSAKYGDAVLEKRAERNRERIRKVIMRDKHIAKAAATKTTDPTTARMIAAHARRADEVTGIKQILDKKVNEIRVRQKKTDAKTQKFVAVNKFDERSGKQDIELVPMDNSRHTLKNGMVVDKNGKAVGSYVSIDKYGNQIAYIEGSPVRMNNILGDIEAWGNLNKASWDMDRLIEANAPSADVARKTQKFLTQFKDEQEALMKTELIKWRTELQQREKELIKNRPVGISKKQLTGDLFRVMEKKANYGDILNTYGEDYVNTYMKPNIIWARKSLDKILSTTNMVLEKNGFDAIPRRDNYITHIQEDPTFWEKWGIGIRDINPLGASVDSDVNPGATRNGVPDAIVGNTENTGVRRKWNPFAQQRRGSAHKQDFFAAIDAYLEPMMFNKYMTPSASRARTIERTFRTFEKAKEKQFSALVDEMGETSARKEMQANKSLSHKNFKPGRRSPLVTAWQEYANVLAGKTNALDRTIIDRLGNGGQAAMDVSTRLQGVTGASTIPGSMSAALAQTLSLPQTIGRDSLSSVMKASKDMLTFESKRSGVSDPLRKSAFMRVRYTDASTKRTSLLRKYTHAASVPMESIERFTGELNWRSAYHEALKNGMTEADAIKQADIEAKKTLAGRGIGDRPMIMNSKALGAWTQFGLEVNNQRLQFFNDFSLSQKTKFLVSAYALNTIMQAIVGQRYLPDYLSAALDTLSDFGNGEDDKKDTLIDNVKQAGQRFVGETAKFVPGAPAIAGTFMDDKTKEAYFGKNSDMSRFGTPALSKVLNLGKDVSTGDWGRLGKDAVSLLPTGGQVKKSSEGIAALQKGYTEDFRGNVHNVYDNTNPLTIGKTVLFGKYAIPGEADASNRNMSLNKEQSAVFREMYKTDPKAAENYFNQVMGIKQKNSNRRGTLTDTGLPDKASAASSGGVVSQEDAKALSEVNAKLELKVVEGKKYIKDGIIYDKNSDTVDTAYYKEKAKTLKNSNSDDAYRAFVLGYGLTTGTKYGKEKDVSTGDTALDAMLKNESKSSKKEQTAASNAIGLFMDAERYKNVPDWVKDRYYKEAGFTKEQVKYAAYTKVDKDTKLDMLYRPIAEQDHQKLLDTLWTHRRKSIYNSQVMASDMIITQLQKEGYLSKGEAKTLKSAKLDDAGNVVEKQAASSNSGGGGRSSRGRGGSRRGSGTGAAKSAFTSKDISQYIKNSGGSYGSDLAALVAKYSRPMTANLGSTGKASLRSVRPQLTRLNSKASKKISLTRIG